MQYAHDGWHRRFLSTSEDLPPAAFQTLALGGVNTVRSTLRLFKAFPVASHAGELDPALASRTVPRGFVIAPAVSAACKDTACLIADIDAMYGRNSDQLNSTFHKSFAKVRDANIQRLIFEQIIHYLTTYGAEAIGAYDQESVFIPAEQLSAPELAAGVRLVTIRGMTTEELKDALLRLLGAGVALSKETIADAIDVARFTGFSAKDIAGTRNKEARAALYDQLGIVPEHPDEFVRFLIFQSTESALVIKSAEVIDALRGRNNDDLVCYFDEYDRAVGLEKLASVFYRFKPIFLALRTNPELKIRVNRLRRLAVTHHKPLPEDLLNSVTAHLKNDRMPSSAAFCAALDAASVFRKIRLAYALKFRTTDADSVLYRVRNGKSYATEFSFPNKEAARSVYEQVLASIVESIRPNIAGRSFFIPEDIKYGLPATEKHFTGTIPSGSYVELDTDMVAGVHWENLPDYRVDLDLSITDATGKYGWDGSYRSDGHDIQFSGDITDAPPPMGATETFRVGSAARGAWLMNLNFYNYADSLSVPFKIVIGRAGIITDHYTVDPNKVVAQINSSIDIRQKALGLLVCDEKRRRFYFAESGFQNRISARSTQATEYARRYLFNYYTDSIVLNHVLAAAGAQFACVPEDADVDLSPERIDKSTFLTLLAT